MGGGKGDLHEYVAPVQTGRIVFEMGGIPEDIAREAMRLAANKLSVKCKVVARR
jgi:large subunit ribosomal protein L16